MKLVAFIGFRSAGKNTAAQPLVDTYGYHLLSFADAMKDALAAIFCWDRELLEGISEESRVWREQVDPWWSKKLGIPDLTPRFMLRHFGTEIMRAHFHQEIWVHHVERRITLLGDQPVVLTDARFGNEIALVRRFEGKLIRIKRGDDPAWMPIAYQANRGDRMCLAHMQATKVHESEWRWVTQKYETIENDGDIASLHAKVVNIIRP
jgi:hypothetical protein